MKNYNPWKTSTFVLLLMASAFSSITASWKYGDINLGRGCKFALVMVAVLVLVQLPDLIRFALDKWKGGRL
ncbi:hypothetical protein LacP0543_16075 [Lactobacillus paracasei subsp. tolerans]|jgi:uncharacterized membrane protein YphA (DoxX/SURF4 family)|uniref:hypothetical protein n=1 Tax=Lacticaseibacillus TaxID=2759736 RepID=UPI00188C5D1D|nr:MULTISPECIES: hypothetical protein [Lacticaseibacillus]MBF4176235.1 hypothetical protein [Lacticaseibacillus paracasei subsp. tolerans]